MKIKFKLTRHQLQVWISFLNHTYDKNVIPPSDMGKLIKAIIVELHTYLEKMAVDRKEINNVILTDKEGLAFLIHSEYWVGMISTPFEQATINQIIGIIDQKTK